METKSKSELTLSEKLNGIIETTFKAGEIEPFLEIVKEYFGCNWKEEYLEYSGHLVFIDKNQKQVCFCRLSSGKQDKVKHPLFIDYLINLDCTDFNKLLLLTTAYFDYKKIEKKVSKSKSFYNKHIEKLLKETNGWLVYIFQLESLYRMVNKSDAEQAVKFRKDINKKLASTFNEAEGMFLFGTTLCEIIDTRMKLDGVFTPNFRGAYNLYSYLNC